MDKEVAEKQLARHLDLLMKIRSILLQDAEDGLKVARIEDAFDAWAFPGDWRESEG